MAQSITRVSVVHTGFGGNYASSFHGESLPRAFPCKRHGYGNEQVYDERKHSKSPTGVRSYLTEAPELDHFAILGVSRGASKREIKSAYRRLVLQHHPDVCTGDSCNSKFLQITNAYERALKMVAPLGDDYGSTADEYVEGCMGVGDDSWDEWEEWMGWEGAGIRDYSSHVHSR